MKSLFLAVAALLVLGAAPGAGGAPASSRIAFALEGGSGPSADLTSLYTVRPDGTGLRRLTVPPTLQADPVRLREVRLRHRPARGCLLG